MSTKGTKVLMSVPDWGNKLYGKIEMCQSLTKGCTACIEQGYRYIVEYTNEFENRIFWNNSRLGIAIMISIWIIFNRNLLEPMYLKRKLWNLNFVRIENCKDHYYIDCEVGSLSKTMHSSRINIRSLLLGWIWWE